MLNVRRLAGSAAAFALLVGCSAQPPAPATASASSATPMAASGSGGSGIEGTYRAPAGGIAGNSSCGTTKFGYPIRVSGGMASMASATNGTLEGPVGPDGSLSIQKGRAMLNGQFANGQFNGTYSSGRCAYTMAYAKR